MEHYEEIHIGKIIESEVRRQGRSIDWIAKQLCYERTNIYNIFKRKSIDTDLLMKISSILNFNFFTVYYNTLHIENNSTKC